MNPWAYLGGVLIFMASVGGSYVYGSHVGKMVEQVKQIEVKEAIEATRESARQGAASEIAKLKTKTTVIQGKTNTYFRDNPVPSDCKLQPDGLRLINEALTGKSDTTGRDSGNVLPRTVSPIR